MQKRKSRSAHRRPVPEGALAKKILKFAFSHQKARGGKYRVCPNCFSLNAVPVLRYAGGDFSTYQCLICGFCSVFFPEYSCKELKSIAQKLSKKKAKKKLLKARGKPKKKKSVKSIARRKN